MATSHAATSSTGVLQSSANVRKEELLLKLGGHSVLHEAVDGFYDKLVADEALKPFFAGTNVELLKWHQYNMMSIAFARVPENFDVAALVLKKHKRFFDVGMNEKHFDLVIHHFGVTLEELKIDESLIQESVAILLPLRLVFQQGAAEAASRKYAAAWNDSIRIAAAVAVTGLVAVNWMRRHRKH